MRVSVMRAERAIIVTALIGVMSGRANIEIFNLCDIMLKEVAKNYA